MDSAPPSTLEMLSTLNEVSSNPPSPEGSPWTAFPRLVVSPPLSRPNPSEPGEGAKPRNGPGGSPAEEQRKWLR